MERQLKKQCGLPNKCFCYKQTGCFVVTRLFCYLPHILDSIVVRTVVDLCYKYHMTIDYAVWQVRDSLRHLCNNPGLERAVEHRYGGGELHCKTFQHVGLSFTKLSIFCTPVQASFFPILGLVYACDTNGTLCLMHDVNRFVALVYWSIMHFLVRSDAARFARTCKIAHQVYLASENTYEADFETLTPTTVTFCSYPVRAGTNLRRFVRYF